MRRLRVWSFALVATLVLVIGTAAFLLSEVATRRIRPLPDSLRYDPSRVSIEAHDQVRLIGSFHPADQPSHRCVAILHGVGSSRADMPGITRSFQLAGFHVLLPDSRAHGESGGKLITYGLLEKEDLKRWVGFLTGQDCSRGIFALGISMGAAVLAQTLPEESRIRAAAAEASFSSFAEIGQDRVWQMVPFLGWLSRPIVFTGLTYLRLSTGLDFWAADPSAAAKRTQTPVLLIHGTADTNIAPKHSERLLAWYRNAKLHWVKGGQHADCFGRDQVSYMGEVLAWFR
jgi:alpha-beta hydrolase superfamily lysophospholipase